MSNAKDNRLRLRILDSLCQGMTGLRLTGEEPYVEITNDNRIIQIGKFGGKDWIKNDITAKGMLYEIAAMAQLGWIVTFDPVRKAKAARKGAYRITPLGFFERDRLREAVFVSNEQDAKHWLEGRSTHHLLALLKKSRSGSVTAGGFAIYGDWIKDILATRPHVERPTQRRARLAKKEKGDKRREKAKKSKPAGQMALKSSLGLANSRNQIQAKSWAHWSAKTSFSWTQSPLWRSN